MNELTLSLGECKLIVQKFLNTQDFEIKCHEVARNESNNIFEIHINVSVNNARREVRLLGTHFLSYPLQPQTSHYHNISTKFRDTDVDWTTVHFAENNNFIALVDLSKQPFRLLEHRLLLDNNHIRLVLQALAKQHVQLLKIRRENTEDVGIIDRRWLENLCALIDLLPDSRSITNEKFKAGIATLIETKHEFKCKVLCHFYLGGEAVLFRYNNNGTPTECKLLHLDTPHYTSPIFDVLQFIYMVTTNETLQNHYHEFLRHYEELQSELPKEQLEAAAKELLPLIKLRTSCFRQFQRLPRQFSSVVDGFKTDENYRKLMVETLEELRDAIAHPELSLEDCFAITTNKIGNGQFKLLSYDLLPIGNVSGFFGDHRKLRIDISVANQRQVLNLFVKFTPKGKAQQSIASDCGSFLKEVFFYRDFVRLCRKHKIKIIDECTTPCYFSRHNDVLVFEDFAIRKYATLNLRQPLLYETVQLVVKQLAKFHASSIILEERLREELKTQYSLIDDFEEGLQESFFTKAENHQGAKSMLMSIEALDRQISIFPDLSAVMLTEDFQKKIQNAYETVFELIKPSTQFRNAVCHGDLWLSNILVEENLKDCRFVDFQIMRYCPPAHDLLGFIHLTTNRAFRKQYFQQVIKLYHDELSKILNEHGCDSERIYSFEKFMQSVEYMLPQAVCQTVIYYQVCVGDPGLLQEYMATEEMVRQIFLDDRRDFIVEMCERDPVYKERGKESLEDLMEMCLKYF